MHTIKIIVEPLSAPICSLCKYKTKKKEYNSITVTNTLKGDINSTALKLMG